jgi:superfamily II DNA or RNA helicase
MLADDMGLGKTLQAIAAAAWLADHADVRKILIVCPASLKHQWAREIERFTGEKAQMIQGPAAKRGVQYRGSRRFVIVNYELTYRDLSVINETLRPDLLILDEAQRIKNWQTKIASTIKLISSRYAFVLTGTPLENRLEDLYSLLQVVDFHVLGPLWRYQIDFHVTDERGKVIGYRNLSELRQRIAPVMLRRDRRLVSEQLPDRIELRLDVPMTQKQQELHDAGLASAGRLAHIAKRRALTPSEQNRLMAALQQARMACDAAGLVDGETVGSPKLTEMANLLEDLCLQEDRKVVIFSQWERMTRMVEAVIRDLNLGFVRLHGGVPTARRGDLLESFRSDASIQVLISTDAGGVGLNLQAASALINLDMPWNPAVLDQRIARIHRLGQKRKVEIILMLAADSYEQQVARLVRGKRDLFEQVVDKDASEDVVGVSKKMLETLIADLGESQPRTDTPSEHAEIPAAADTGTAAQADQQPDADLAQDTMIKSCIVRIQEAFGSRIERILGSSGGLLVIMSPVDVPAEQFAIELSESIPVALMEPQTYLGLKRLGAASPIAEMKLLLDIRPDCEAGQESAYTRLAKDKLSSAELLIDQGQLVGAADLLAAAMIAGVADRAGWAQLPNADEVSLWVYTDALPNKHLLAEQGAGLVRAISLAKAPSIPEALVFEILEDARMIIN